MKAFVIIILYGMLLSFSAGSSAHASTTVGMHNLKISEEGKRSRLVSVPFLRVPSVFGRLDGVAVASESQAPRLIDQQGAFNALSDEGTYILRVTDGVASGEWFILGEVTDSGRSVSVEEDGLVGFVAALNGNESFAIHKLFTLNELFPADSSDFPASAIDLNAMQVHFFDGKRFAKHWLSDGTLTEHTGWTFAEEGHLKDGGSLAILPGTSFLVVYPQGNVDRSIQVNGVVPEHGLVVPMYPGYNYISVKYSVSLSGGLPAIEDYLNILGLKQSGFRGGASPEEGDLLYALDETNGTLIEGYYYDDHEERFKAAGETADLIDIQDVGPGRGFVILNRGEPYLWKFNH